MTTPTKGNEMSRRKTVLVIQVDLDSVPGAFHTPESAKNNIQAILDNAIPHYEPRVERLPFASY
jgi:hypothetical protein